MAQNEDLLNKIKTLHNLSEIIQVVKDGGVDKPKPIPELLHKGFKRHLPGVITHVLGPQDGDPKYEIDVEMKKVGSALPHIAVTHMENGKPAKHFEKKYVKIKDAIKDIVRHHSGQED
jgi:hypothetical protein